ncbi:MAG TPA: 3-oxoacyl-ACP synthase [Bacteroidia bacterium]|jgi:transcription elongation GreA/GreB family factor|nr:3-oxoacyl-ACP synthase [Bacteroidia bacterium]
MIVPDLSIKHFLYDQCLVYIDKCINHAQKALQDALQSGNDETKSSAGDKHETARSLLQLEQEKNTKQLNDLLLQKDRLLKIDASRISQSISMGSIVITSSGNFYIAIAAGKLELQGETYFAISPMSPIGLKLKGLKADDTLMFNNKEYQIRYVL